MYGIILLLQSNYSRTLSLNYLGAKIRIRFNESYLKQIKFI